MMSRTRTTRWLVWCCLWLALGLSSAAQNELRPYSARNGAFSFQAPSAFRDSAHAAKNELVDLEVPGFGVSLIAQREKAEEVEVDQALDRARQSLSDSGATILGSAKAQLASRPAFSLLVGGVKPGVESLFVYNLRSDYWYVFVLNYPQGQRQDAADLWKVIAPTIRFHS